MKLFYTGPIESAELLTVMMENHNITFSSEKEDPNLPEDDLNPTVPSNTANCSDPRRC